MSETYNVDHQWVVRVGFRHEQLYCGQQSTDVQCRTPAALQTQTHTDIHSVVKKDGRGTERGMDWKQRKDI